jgi:tetratricopeptide (TPR) repeat protein
MSEPGAPVNPLSPQVSVGLGAGSAAASGPAAAGDASDAGKLNPRMHVGVESLQRFMAGALPPAEMRQVLRHLLRGCGSCQESARAVWNLPGAQLSFCSAVEMASTLSTTPPLQPLQTTPRVPGASQAAASAPEASSPPSHPSPPCPPGPPGPPSEDSGYDAVLDRVFSRISREEAAVEAARQRAAILFSELMQHPPAHQELLVHNSARFRDRMLCENLLAASHEEGFREPARSLQLARLAMAVAERLAAVAAAIAADPTAEPAFRAGSSATELELLAGLRARAWAQVGNALRIGSDHGGAMTAFEAAEALLAANPRISLIDKARVLDLRASLCKDRRQFVEAGRLLDRVIAIYRRLGQSNLMGRAVAQKAMVLQQAVDPRGCLELLHQALELIDPHDDPRWYLTARHNLISALVDDGRPREAFALLFHTRPLYLKLGDRMILLRLRWLEGQVAHALHRLEQAEAAFREVREAFVELGLSYDTALVSLDLAAVYAERGRTSEMRRLAEETLVWFESRQIHREAMAAFLLFCNAASREFAGLGTLDMLQIVREVAAFLKQARNTPDLRFSPRVPV